MSSVEESDLPVKWIEKRHLKPATILKAMAAARSRESKDKARFGLFAFEDARAALATMVEITEDVSEIAKERIISRALANAAGSGTLTPDAVMEQMNAELRKMQDTRPLRYVLTTSVSLADVPPTRKLSLLDCDIVFRGERFPKAFETRSKFDRDYAEASEPQHTPDDYCKVTIACDAKLTHDAVEKCVDAIDLARSLMCLLENSSMSVSMGGLTLPINKIRLGGLHALHFADGRLAEDFHWFNPSFATTSAHEIEVPEGSKRARNHRWAFRQFSKLPHKSRNRLKDALLLYVRAFDERDRNTTLIRGWRAVELLLGSGDNCEPVARRCAALYKDFEYHRQIVDHLRECRNRSAHAGEDLKDATTHCHQLQRYFRDVVIFHLANASVFESIDEANSFLDLPRDAKALLRRQFLHRKALKFHAPRS